MVDLAELEDTLKTTIAKALNDINKIESKDLSQREKFIKNIDKHIDEIKDNLELYDYTCLDYTKRPEFSQYKKKFADLKKQYEDLKVTFEKKKNPELAARLSGEGNPDYVDPKSTLKALERIGAKVDDAHIIADGIMTEEERQLESLKKTLGNIKDAKSDIKSARKIVSYFAKEVYKDKYWRIGMIIIIIALLLVIIKSIMNSTDGDSTNSMPYDYFNGYN